MHERNEFLVMLLAAGFFSSSFWPVVCGWVDLTSLDGWLVLFADFGTMVIGCTVFGLMILAGNLIASLATFLYRACNDSSSKERELSMRCIRLTARMFYLALKQGWKLSWWIAQSIRRRVRAPN